MNNPTMEPNVNFNARLTSPCLSPLRNINTLADNSRKKQTTINSKGAMILAKDAITKADNAKPEKPRTTPAKKTIKLIKAK